MDKKSLYALWGVLFALCAGLGFIPEPTGVLKAILTGLAAAFFVPPALLLYGGVKHHDKGVIKLVRNLSALSLALTGVLLALNFLTALGAEWLGQVLYYMLVVVSSPMICWGNWALCLFFWACLLMVSVKLLRRK